MIEGIGILALVQGVGGVINRLAGSNGRSWFGLLYLVGPHWQIPASALLAVAGLVVIVLASRHRARRATHQDPS